MQTYLKLHKNGAVVTMEKLFPSGMYSVAVRGADGELIDRTRCDDYRMAMEYRRAFNDIARHSA